jgi:hypothetical protein
MLTSTLYVNVLPHIGDRRSCASSMHHGQSLVASFAHSQERSLCSGPRRTHRVFRAACALRSASEIRRLWARRGSNLAERCRGAVGSAYAYKQVWGVHKQYLGFGMLSRMMRKLFSLASRQTRYKVQRQRSEIVPCRATFVPN